MPWSSGGSSTRRQEFPANWYTEIRPAVLNRDNHRCRWPRPDRRAGICNATANQVDHRDDRDSWEVADLWSLCQYHHMRKTQGQSIEARKAALAKAKHPVERHPGLK